MEVCQQFFEQHTCQLFIHFLCITYSSWQSHIWQCDRWHRLSHKKDQNLSTDFSLTSMSTLSWKRSPFSIRYNNIALFITGMYCFQVSVHNLKRAGNEWCWGKCHVAADCHIEPRQMRGNWIYTQFAVDHCSDVTEGSSRISVPHVWHYNEWPLVQYICMGEF